MYQQTHKHYEYLKFIDDYRHVHGYAPLLREIADNFGVAKITAYDHIQKLVKMGLLKKSGGKFKQRGLELVVPVKRPPLRFPIVGEISIAGVSYKTCSALTLSLGSKLTTSSPPPPSSAPDADSGASQ